MADRSRFERVWDAPVRLFHWLLVGLIAFSWWSGEHHDMEWHRRSGLAILGLLVFRIYWGFLGGRTARFAQFLRGPRAAISYLRGLSRGAEPGPPGHNPLGGWSVALMLATLVAMVTAGLFAVDIDGLESGPLADFVSFDAGRIAAGLHHKVFTLLLVLIALHVAAILFYLVRLRKDLVTPMLHGRRRLAEGRQATPLDASLWKAAIGIVLAGGCVYLVANAFRL